MATELDEAERDFTERAFSPFWDRVERVVVSADAFRKTVTVIEELAERDRRLVAEYRGLIGSEPTTAIKKYRLSASLCGRGSLPDPADELARLKTIIRAAQCDIDFAMILESRKTRRAIEESAHEVGARIDLLRSSIEGGFSRIEDLLLPDSP
jgi:hypothetical protein